MDCRACRKPEGLEPENETAWQAWQYASVTGRDGTTGALRTADIKAAMDIAGCADGDYERIITIERIYQDKKK